MSLAEKRQVAAELSKGTSTSIIKDVILQQLEKEKAGGSLIDFGAGMGELLTRMHGLNKFTKLAGTDLFPRPANLPDAIAWHQQDLNDKVQIDEQFDVVICSETIEHLENPRLTFRMLDSLTKPGGIIILTQPNQESIRAYFALFLAGHFVHFIGASYPAHITALLRLDLSRMANEVGWAAPRFFFTNRGAIPKLTSLTWQQISLGLFRGRFFSDNVGMVVRKPS
jgi:2-polyprenyl-3-methyl-5-hydroxy-6-metoxy-1,4-benzoquinol methylase